MSDRKPAGGNLSENNALPLFMKENSKTNYMDIEEKQSWLANNLHRLMIWVSVAWFAIVLIYITQFFGWSNLFLMMPDEFGGFLAGITLPLAIIWVVMAYIDRGTSFKQEAKFLRAYMNQLVYPEQGAPQTAKAMADAIRSQVVELQQVTKLATDQTAVIKDEIRSNIKEFSKLVSTLDAYSSKTIVELSEGVKFLVKNFETISSKAEISAQMIAGYNREFVSGVSSFEQSSDELFKTLLPRIKELKETGESLKSITENNSHNILQANELLSRFSNESNNNLQRMQEVLSGQTVSLQKISEKAIANCGILQKTVNNEISNLDSTLNTHLAKMDSVINEHDSNLQAMIGELTNQALESCNALQGNIAQGFTQIKSAVGEQVAKIDDAVLKNGKIWQENVKNLDTQTDHIISKFGECGVVMAQEIDKLKLRSGTLEESVALQVSGLTHVADEVVTALQKTDEALQNNIVSLQKKSEIANENINSYSESVELRTQKLEEAATAALEKSAQIAEDIASRHELLSNTMDDISSRMEILSNELNTSADNLKQQAGHSIENMNNVSENMNKHAGLLTEASSVVTTQSQISEAALAQQQRNIANSASRIEDIKLELKRQIDELAKASASLETDASGVVTRLKKQTDEMLKSCNDVITKSRQLHENMDIQAEKFGTSADDTLSKVGHFEEVLQAQAQNMDNLSKIIHNRAHEIDEILTRQNKEINKATDHSTAVFQNLASSFETQNTLLSNVSETTTAHVAEIVNALDDKATTLGILFKEQENEFFGFCDKISENTTMMGEALQKQIATIEQSADKVFSRMVLLEEDTNKHAEAVANNSHHSIDKLMEIENMLNEKNNFVGKLVSSVSQDLSGIADNIQDKINLFSSTVKGIKDESNASAGAILENCTKLQAANSNMSSESKNTLKLMEEHVKNMDVSLVKAKLQAEDIKKMLEQQKDNMTDVVNTLATQTRLGESSLAQQYKYLSDATVEVAQKIQEINETLKTNTDNIFDTSTKIAYEFDVLGDRLIKAGEDVHKTSKNSIKDIEQVNLRLSQCSDDLDATIHHSVENIGGVFNDYEKYLAGFNTVTAETSSGVIEINNLISEQSDKMIQISEDTKKLVDCFNTVLNETSGVLSNRANQAYDKVKGLGENLKNLSLQLEEATKISATHFENSGDKLRAAIVEIAANAERISNEIRSSGEVFIKQSGVLVAATDDTLNKVHGVMDSLVDASKEFDRQGDDIMKRSIHFNEVISSQIKNLNDNSKKAEDILSNLTQNYQGIQIDAFLKNASAIIERMETMSVDINRVFNAKDEDDLWKRFYNGDTSVFVRYLARNMTKQQITAIRNEYEKNADFRTLVNGYLSEFETLIERAKVNERSGILLSVISGADIGKLYYILAKTLDKVK